MIWSGLFLCFLLAAAWQDFRNRQVDVCIFVVFGTAAVVSGAVQWLILGENYSVPGHMAGSALGGALLVAAMASRGGIGTGDGCFFLVSGLMLGFWENLALLCYSTLCCGLFCLGYFVWCRTQKGVNVGKRTVPFLPFAVLPGIWLVFCRMTGAI